MQLQHPFYRLPLVIDAARVALEMTELVASDWIEHPDGLAGNSASQLVSVGGDDELDIVGTMALCPRIHKLPYVKQILAKLDTVVGRSRFMRLAAGAKIPPHCDINRYWRHRFRVHFVISTNSGVSFECDGTKQRMAIGEVWVLDTWRTHSVCNDGATDRVHLVVDTVGSPKLWQMMALAWTPNVNNSQVSKVLAAERISYRPDVDVEIPIERMSLSLIPSPDELENYINRCLADLSVPVDTHYPTLVPTCAQLVSTWRYLWQRFGADAAQRARYDLLLNKVLKDIETLSPEPKLSTNKLSLRSSIRSILPAVDPSRRVKPSAFVSTLGRRNFDRPVFIVSAPRAGSSLLFETLALNPGFSSLAAESHAIFEGLPQLRPEARRYHSNVLDANDANAATAAQFSQRYYRALSNRYGAALAETAVRLLDKTPKNSLRIHFLRAVFPDAKFIYLYRRPEANISSMIEAWQLQRFVTYRNLPGWDRALHWSLLLPEGWRNLRTAPVAEIAAFQYMAANRAIIEALSILPKVDVCTLAYEQMVAMPERAYPRAWAFAGLDTPPLIDYCSQPLSRHTTSPPKPDKWRLRADEMAPYLPAANALYDTEIVSFASAEK